MFHKHVLPQRDIHFLNRLVSTVRHTTTLLNSFWRPVITATLAGLVIFVWQASFIPKSVELENRYGMRGGASGRPKHLERFLYFYHHLGLFPITSTLEKPWPDDPEGAEKLLKRDPSSLRTEWQIATRFGDLGRLLLLLPSVWMGDSIHAPQLSFLYYIVFSILLWILWLSFWRAGRWRLGLLLIILIGSNPFQLWEVHRSENFHCWHIFNALALLSLCLPFFSVKSTWPTSRWFWLSPLACGIWISMVREVRPELIAMTLAPIIIFLLCPPLSIKKRLISILLVTLPILCIHQWVGAHTQQKISEAERLVSSLGGTPFTGSRDKNHQVWHPIWCGLGDFDSKYGHCWNDVIAAQRTIPHLNEKLGMHFPWPVEIHEAPEVLDASGLYLITPYEQEEHEILMKAEVLERITNDALWYLEILAKRFVFVLKSPPPISLAIGSWSFRIPLWAGLYLILALFWCCWAKGGFELRLLLFTLPMSATALVIYSQKGNADYLIYPAIALAIVLDLLITSFLTKSKLSS